MGRVRVNKGLTAAVLALLATGCSTEFERRYAEAQRMRLDAAAVGAEWLQTEELLAASREAAGQGDTSAALALVEEALFQAEAAIRQAEYEADAWRGRVVR
jgi:hypothetical protein